MKTSEAATLAERALALVHADPVLYATRAAIARDSGVSEKKLEALFASAVQRAPEEVIAREKIRLACERLVAGRVRSADVSQALGFESTSAFEELFRQQTGMTPRGYARLRTSSRFTIVLPDDYRAEYAVRTQGRDQESVSERAAGDQLQKAVVSEGETLLLSIRLSGRHAHCSVLSGRATAAHRAARRLLGLDIDPRPFEAHIEATPALRPLLGRRRGLRIPQTATVFEAIAWSIVGQQVNLAFAFKLRRAMIELAGPRCGAFLAHPDAPRVANLDYSDLTRRQFSRSKAEYLIDTARLIASGRVDPEAWPRQSAAAVSAALTAIRGIGPWSANYVMMRGCAFRDCVPLGDTGLTSSLHEFFRLRQRPDAKRTERLMRVFSPYRSLATFHLWMRKGEPA